MGVKSLLFVLLLALLFVPACDTGRESSSDSPDASTAESDESSSPDDLLAKYTSVRLTTDLDALTDAEKQMLPLLIEAADVMNAAFWPQAYGDPDELMTSLEDDRLQRFARINYGPWDRIADNEPFAPGHGPKPEGANFYPEDMTREEFEQAASESDERRAELTSLYTMVRRDEDGNLSGIPYSVFFAEPYSKAAGKLREAAELAEDAGLRRYLDSRADALESDDYRQSDLDWMDMKTNTLDIVIGPVETYEDQLFGLKAANESFVLVKDQEWSERLARYVTLLPELQRALPVEDEYKQETPGLESDLNAYDVVYYAGDANAGSKPIAVNLPNDEQVQLEKGTRRLQLKNAMRAKFDKILIPIADELIAEEQRELIDFDAFFANVMFHEVAHGLGIKRTLSGDATVREALKERASALEEGKADVLGLFMITMLAEQGELDAEKIDSHYVTFLASIFRSVRFGAASAHGRANLMQLNFLEEAGAFAFDEEGERYSVDLDKMTDAINELAARILTFQGDGDYEGLGRFMETYGGMSDELEESLARLAGAGIPVDIVFEQGVEVLGLVTDE